MIAYYYHNSPQIVTLQALHYLALGILVPSLLTIFANPSSLAYEGGPASVGMIMDWRELAGRPTSIGRSRGWNAFDAVYSGGIEFSASKDAPLRQLGGDPLRGWLIAVAWVAAAFVEYVGPRLVLPHAVSTTLLMDGYLSDAVSTSSTPSFGNHG